MFVDPALLSGSQPERSLLSCKFICPPYCGLPSESHQFPVAVVVVVVAVVVCGKVVVVLVVVDVAVLIDVVVDVDMDVEIVVDVAQDTSSIVATIKKLKPNQTSLFFIFYSYFINNKHTFVMMNLLIS